MKKLRQWFRDLWFNNVINPYMHAHKAKCTVAMRDTIVYQMWAAQVGFPHINKWLHKMKSPTIKGYVMTKTGPRLFYVMPEGEYKREIEAIYGRIILVF